MHRAKTLLALMSLAVLACTGCSMRAPVLLYRGTSASASTTVVPNYSPQYVPPGEPAIPLKAGVQVAAARETQVTRLSTYVFPFHFISGGFPKRDEMEFLRDSIARDIVDTRLFQYAYPGPFDESTPDVIVEAAIADIEMSNNSGYSTLMNLPLISIALLLGAPAEIFKARMDVSFDVKTKDGTLIKSYAVSHSGKQAVSLYKMPWANYIWADSVFRRVFLACMDDFRSQIVADTETIRKAVK